MASLTVEPVSERFPTVGESPSGGDPNGEPSNGVEAAPPANVPAGPHFLESEWVMWEHRAPDKNSKSYEDNMAKLCEFATVEDFWRLWNNIPKPSQIFYDGRSKKRFKERTVESFSLFKKNIKPEWEDAMNRTGAEWFCRKTFPMPQLVRVQHRARRALGLETVPVGVAVDGVAEQRVAQVLHVHAHLVRVRVRDRVRERVTVGVHVHAHLVRAPRANQHRHHGAPPVVTERVHEARRLAALALGGDRHLEPVGRVAADARVHLVRVS